LDFPTVPKLVDLIRSASSKFDLSYWNDVDRDRRFPYEYWESLARSGLFGILIDKKWGGMEKALLDLTLAVQETSERFAGLGSYLYLSGSLVCRIFSANGTEEQKQEFLPKLARGDLKISIALSEENSGFDSSSILSKARKVSDGKYVLQGSKTFVNNVDLADYLVLFVRTADRDVAQSKSLGVSMFLVKSDNPKIRKKKLDRLGMNFVNSFAIDFDDLVVEEISLLGGIGRAWYNIIGIFNMDRILTAASLVGTGQLALNEAADWARRREVFGKVIGSNQGIQFPLADAQAQILVAESMTLKAAYFADQGKSFTNEAAYSLLVSSTAASQATDRALQTFGGHGYYRDYHVERFWRDVRAHRIHPISEELLLASIAERSLGLPKSY
jgi:acyl-CoA dehydrogenase